ncbi:MAG: PHP domain-containing protein [Promethearchaeota archaeon]
MNFFIFLAVFLLSILYILLGLYLVELVNFRFKNYYNDEDVTYNEGRPDWVPKNAFLIDFHAHTRASDGIFTPRQLILWHISNGYDGVVVSDHNNTDAIVETMEIARKEFPNFLVIPGIEFTSLRNHLNIFGLKRKEKVDKDGNKRPYYEFKTIPNLLWTTKRTIRKAIKEAHEQGALVQFNHRDWYFHKFYLSKEWYLENGIDGFEVFNGFKFIDDEAEEFVNKNRHKKVMFLTAGTDVHDPVIHHRVYTEVITEDRTINGVLNALREGKTRVYYNVEEESKRIPPEKGKLKKSHEREQFIKKWKWIYWAGISVVIPQYRPRLLTFLLVLWVLGIILSLIA